jgi:hypothetical protein
MIIIVVYILSFLILEYNPDLSLPHAPVVIYAMPHALCYKKFKPAPA